MYMRTSSVVALALLVSACSGQGDDAPASDVNSLAEAEAAANKQRADDGLLSCAIAGEREFTRSCQFERNEEQQGLVLTIRHPDGGFRRLLVTRDGRGVIAADGSETAVVTPVSDREIEVALAGNRYRLPATVKGQEGAPKP